MLHTNFVEKIELHILCPITFFENLEVYEIMWKNIVDLDRPLMKIWRIRIAFWKLRLKTHSEYVILSASPQQQ
jgi:hypothetical protein